jgi:hypothetical protein
MNYPFTAKVRTDFECEENVPEESFWMENDEWTMMHIEKHYFLSEKLEYYPSDWHPTNVLDSTKSWQLDDFAIEMMSCFFETISFDVPFVFPVHQNEYSKFIDECGAFTDEIMLIEGTEDMGGNTGTTVEPLTNEMMTFIDKLLDEYELFSQNLCIASKRAKPEATKRFTQRKPKQKVKNAKGRWNKKTSHNDVVPLNKSKTLGLPKKTAFQPKKQRTISM